MEGRWLVLVGWSQLHTGAVLHDCITEERRRREGVGLFYSIPSKEATFFLKSLDRFFIHDLLRERRKQDVL
jgi:hypothetical protein